MPNRDEQDSEFKNYSHLGRVGLAMVVRLFATLPLFSTLEYYGHK